MNCTWEAEFKCVLGHTYGIWKHPPWRDVEKMRLDVVLFQNDFLLPPYVGPSTRWVLVDNRSQHATPSAERSETQTCHVRLRAACLCKLLTPL